MHIALLSAGHEVPALVAGLVFPFYPADAPNRRGRDHEHLAPVREGGRPRLGQRDRIAFLVGGGLVHSSLDARILSPCFVRIARRPSLVDGVAAAETKQATCTRLALLMSARAIVPSSVSIL